MNIALVGYGKMGKEIEKIALERKHNIVFVIDKNNSANFTTENLQKADIVIEFSTPYSAVNNYIKCFNAGIPVVSGTTGWLSEKKKVEEYCRKCDTGFFYASNFSLGVNLFFELNKKLASLMDRFNSYDVDMEEIHHIHKLDAPSGTAISLAEEIICELDRKNKWELENECSSEDSLSIRALREAEVSGTHSVRYFSDVDEITICHKAYSRKGFALGAVLAAEFMHNKKGIYSMRDLLSNKE